MEYYEEKIWKLIARTHTDEAWDYAIEMAKMLDRLTALRDHLEKMAGQMQVKAIASEISKVLERLERP